MSVSLQIELPDEARKLFDELNWLVRLACLDDGFPAMAKPIVEKAKAIAPNSKRSGTRKGWSKKYREDPKWQVESSKHIGHRIIKTPRGILMYIGAQWPQGNKQQFNASPDGRKEVLWGRSSGRVWTNPQRRFIDRAFDETKTIAVAACVAAVEKTIKEMK